MTCGDEHFEPDSQLLCTNILSIKSLVLKCYLLIYVFSLFLSVICFLSYSTRTFLVLQVCGKHWQWDVNQLSTHDARFQMLDLWCRSETAVTSRLHFVAYYRMLLLCAAILSLFKTERKMGNPLQARLCYGMREESPGKLD